MKKVLLIFAACLLLLTGCQSGTDHPKVLIDDPALLVTAEGPQVDVCDRQTGQAYVFHTGLRKRTQATVERHTAVKTSTITIDTLPGGGLEIHTGQNIYRIGRKIRI